MLRTQGVQPEAIVDEKVDVTTEWILEIKVTKNYLLRQLTCLRLSSRQVVLVQILMDERDEPPYQGEYQPTSRKAYCQHLKSPFPLCVHQAGEDIVDVVDISPRKFWWKDVVLAVFQNGSSS